MKVMDLKGHCLLELFSSKGYVTVIVPYGIDKVTPSLSEKLEDFLNRHPSIGGLFQGDDAKWFCVQM